MGILLNPAGFVLLAAVAGVLGFAVLCLHWLLPPGSRWRAYLSRLWATLPYVAIGIVILAGLFVTFRFS